jgi:uncharacterized Tic20 family protein
MPEFSETPPTPENHVRHWAMALHLSQLAHYLVPLGGIVAPIVIWQVQKDQMPEIDQHGRIVANWLVSLLIYLTICGVLFLVVIGFFLIWIPLALALIYPIIGGIKASQGEAWHYPGSFRFF